MVPALPVVAGAFLAGQVYRAAHRRDLPSFPNQDPSGTFGDTDAPPLRIVALGDSSVTAPGVEDLDNVWVRRIARTLAERYRVELVSLAGGGSRAGDVVQGQLEEAVRLRPDVASVSVGANDVLRGVTARSYARRLAIIVDRLASSGAAVVVWGMGDLSSIPRLPPALRRIMSRNPGGDAIDAVFEDTGSKNGSFVNEGRCLRAALADLEARAARELIAWPDARGEHDEVHVEVGHAVIGEPQSRDPPVGRGADLSGRRSGEHAQAQLLDVTAQRSPRAVVELHGHEPVGELHERKAARPTSFAIHDDRDFLDLTPVFREYLAELFFSRVVVQIAYVKLRTHLNNCL